MYVRKTKDIYKLFWNGEEIDETESRADAIFLKMEYNKAFHGGAVVIKKRRVKK